jgi:DNA-binding response OmpR family regulator
MALLLDGLLTESLSNHYKKGVQPSPKDRLVGANGVETPPISPSRTIVIFLTGFCFKKAGFQVQIILAYVLVSWFRVTLPMRALLMEILAVDDDGSVLQLLKEILTHTGYHKVKTASHAKAALVEISDEEQHFDCFLIDIQMPEVDGISLVRMIRETPDYRDSPILMITAMDDKSYLDRAFSAGATDYVTKPFDLYELRKRIVEAHRLVHEGVRASQQPLMAGQFRKTGDGAKTFTLEQPIPLKIRDMALGHREFENYVLELAKNCDFDASFRAVKIADVERHYRQYSSEDFALMINAAARAIQSAMTSGRGAFSYRGNGAFICLCAPPVTSAASHIEDVLTQKLKRSEEASPIPDIRMLVGNPVRLKGGSEDVVLEQMSDALESVEQKSFEARDVVSMTQRLLSRRPTTEDQQRLEQKAYQSLLNKLLRGPDDEAWSRKLQERENRLYRSS